MTTKEVTQQGRKAKPLIRVKYKVNASNMANLAYNGRWRINPTQISKTIGELPTIECTRFKLKKNLAWELWGIWDKKAERWLYPCEPTTLYATREEAKKYLRNTTTDDPKYQLTMVERVLDGEDAA